MYDPVGAGVQKVKFYSTEVSTEATPTIALASGQTSTVDINLTLAPSPLTVSDAYVKTVFTITPSLTSPTCYPDSYTWINGATGTNTDFSSVPEVTSTTDPFTFAYTISCSPRTIPISIIAELETSNNVRQVLNMILPRPTITFAHNEEDPLIFSMTKESGNNLMRSVDISSAI